MTSSKVDLEEAFDKLSRTAMRVKKERDELLRVAKRALDRFNCLIDADEATEADIAVHHQLQQVITKAETP